MPASSKADCKRLVYQWESSDDTNPSWGLERICAALAARRGFVLRRQPAEEASSFAAMVLSKIKRCLIWRISFVAAFPQVDKKLTLTGFEESDTFFRIGFQILSGTVAVEKSYLSWNSVGSHTHSNNPQQSSHIGGIMKCSIIGAALAAGLALAGCHSSSSNNSPPATGPRVVGDIAIPNVTAGTNYSFDLGVVVNHSPGFYAFTDRNNKSVNRIDIASQTLTAQIAGVPPFAGAVGTPVNNAISGPDGVNDVGLGILYAGDVGSVKVINTFTNTTVANITGGSLGASAVRADEGCVGTGAALGTYIISSPEAATPFATVIDVATHSVIATITFTDAAAAPSAGLEQCRYDPANDLWFFNNDGTTANPHGELNVLTGASVRAIAAGATVNYTALAGVKIYPMTATPAPGCDPTGLALGPGSDIAIMCREGTTGAPLLVQILNRLTGAIVASINAGGGDQLEYDPSSNRYYGGNSRWTATGNAGTGGACSATSLCTPSMSVIDATTRTLVTMVPTGNNAHSVAVDPISGHIFMPYSSATAPAGCGTCAANGFINGGVHVLVTN